MAEILLRGTVITDIHCGFDLKKEYGCKLGSWASPLLKTFTQIANQYNPDFVANLGDDYIANEHVIEHGRYEENYAMLAHHFNALSAPFAKVQGNHDYALALHRRQIKSDSIRFPLNPRPLPMEFPKARAIFWNANPAVWQSGVEISGIKQREWLKRTLDQSEKPAIVFSHAPFEYYKDAEDLRYIMRDYGNVAIVMHGHKHKPDRLEIIENIPYFTQQSFTECQPDRPLPWGAYSHLTITSGEVKIERSNIMASGDQDMTFKIRHVGRGIETHSHPTHVTPIVDPEI